MNILFARCLSLHREARASFARERARL